jgi:MFS family permease
LGGQSKGRWVPVVRAIIFGILGAVLGYVAAALLSDVVMGLEGVSNFEGGRAMASALVFGPLGGLAGLGLGIWLGLRGRGRRPGLGKLAGQGLLALLGIAALVAGGIFLYWESGEHRLTYDGAGATLAFEIRVPAAFPLPADKGAVDIELDAGSSRMSATLDDAWLRRDADWAVMSGSVELYLRISERLLVLRLPDGKDRLFRLRLPAKPDPDAGWSDWYKVDFIGAPNQPQAARPGPDDPFEIRYKVSVWG